MKYEIRHNLPSVFPEIGVTLNIGDRVTLTFGTLDASSFRLVDFMNQL